MKKLKFFSILIIIFSISSVANAQQMQIDPEVRELFRQIYPNATAEYVLQNAERTAVVDMSKRQAQKEYFYLKGKDSYKNQLQKGDTVRVFDGKAFFSFQEGCYLAQVEKPKEAKPKKRPLSPEERQQRTAAIAETGGKLINLAGDIILSQKNYSSSTQYGYSGSY